MARRLRLVARRLHLVASWLVARWFLGGELVGGEIPWWRGNRIPKKLVRIMTFSNYQEKSRPLFQSLKILDIYMS